MFAMILTIATVLPGADGFSVTTLLPLPPGPPYAANDDRVLSWVYAYALALRIDHRGEQLAYRPPPDREHELRAANLRDLRLLAEQLARLKRPAKKPASENRL